MTDYSKNIINFYNNHYEKFMHERSRELFEKPWLDKILSLINSSEAHILDIGCGFGVPIAQYIISNGHKLTGIDASAPMIAHCKSHFPDQTWLLEDMRTMNLQHQFDGIIAWDSFFHLNHDDQKKMFPIFSKHLRPRSPLLFTAGPEHGLAINPLWGDSLFHASFSPDEYQALLEENGFEDINYTLNDQSSGGHSVFCAIKS